MDEARIIAWIDGELDGAEAAEVAAAVAADPALAAQAEAHRRLKARFAAAFDPIAAEPVALPERPAAAVVSLAAVREARAQKRQEQAPRRNWAIPGAIAASLVAGVLLGHQWAPGGGIADRADTLALSTPVARALDGQLSGEAGPVRVALSFRDHQGDYCRSFTGQHLSGVACREEGGWQLRYGAPGTGAQGDYRMAGGDTGTAQAVTAMIAGDPLDAAQEQKARNAGWRR